MFKTALKKYWPTLLTIVGAVIGFENASVQAYAAQHPTYAVPVLAAWGIVLHLAPSPLSK